MPYSIRIARGWTHKPRRLEWATLVTGYSL